MLTRLLSILWMVGLLFALAPRSEAVSTLKINGAPVGVVTDVNNLTFGNGQGGAGGSFWVELTASPPLGVLWIAYTSPEFTFRGNYTVTYQAPTLNGGVLVEFTLFHAESATYRK